MIDVNFDFTSDTQDYWDGYWDRCNGLGGCGKYDPDSYSPTLLEYTKKFYSRKLPNGQIMELMVPRHHTYFEGMNFAFDKTMGLMEAEIVGKVEIPGVLNVGDIDKTDGKERAAELAEKFV